MYSISFWYQGLYVFLAICSSRISSSSSSDDHHQAAVLELNRSLRHLFPTLAMLLGIYREKISRSIAFVALGEQLPLKVAHEHVEWKPCVPVKHISVLQKKMQLLFISSCVG
jgi:hypothetical protein